jgi:hypothetical protein
VAIPWIGESGRKALGWRKGISLAMVDIKLKAGDRVKYKLQLGDRIPENKHVGQYIHGVVVQSDEDVSVRWRHDPEKVQHGIHPLDLELE